MSGATVLVVMRLGDVKARDKLTPLLASPAVSRVILVRHARVDLGHPKLTQAIHRSSLDQGVARMRPLASLKNLARCLYHGTRLARREKAHAVVGFNFTPYGILAWLIARLSGASAVACLIGADFNTRLTAPLIGPPLRAVLRHCDRVTIFGEPARQQLLTMGVPADRAVVLPNTVDTNRYHPPPGSAPSVSHQPSAISHSLVCTGYLIPRKRVDTLLRALAILRQHKPDATLLVLGDGAQRANLQTLADELGLADAVTFHGWSDRVPELLRTARVFVLLSEAEGLPMAMLEAMSTGLPVVVTDVGANSSIIVDGENGYLVPAPAQPAVVADRLLRLLDDPDHYAACRRGALAVRQTQGYDRTTAVWDDLLRGLI